ncbi:MULTISPECIES: hypothetical protein [unclassified Fibrobacter]|uniref:hypothetical protein n=1 Tax=unclassified Fibrobacter TaxID=2634177 RepID=UPI001E54BD08|nr:MULTISPECIES: hypothetical protein [unclassified Fibrobacter]
MSTSFIVFNIIGLVIVVIAAFRIGMQVSKAAKLEAPEAKNNKSYDECLAKTIQALNTVPLPMHAMAKPTAP